MKFFMLAFLSFSIFADEPDHWSYILGIQEKHEFYQNDEKIVRPKDAWQLLFSLNYIDSKLKNLKDCVFYKVPGMESGTLKIKTISFLDKCESYLISPGDKEIIGIKHLYFSVMDDSVKVSFSKNDFKEYLWEAKVQRTNHSMKSKLHLSSADFKNPKIIFLSPEIKLIKLRTAQFLDKDKICHDINDDCMEVTPSNCFLCKDGWYEIPNGCPIGPKYCGPHICGSKNRPACRRGMKWQNKESENDCRTDSSFAYCSKGLSVYCEGRKAFCR